MDIVKQTCLTCGRHTGLLHNASRGFLCCNTHLCGRSAHSQRLVDQPRVPDSKSLPAEDRARSVAMPLDSGDSHGMMKERRTVATRVLGILISLCSPCVSVPETFLHSTNAAPYMLCHAPLPNPPSQAPTNTSPASNNITSHHNSFFPLLSHLTVAGLIG